MQSAQAVKTETMKPNNVIVVEIIGGWTRSPSHSTIAHPCQPPLPSYSGMPAGSVSIKLEHHFPSPHPSLLPAVKSNLLSLIAAPWRISVNELRFTLRWAIWAISDTLAGWLLVEAIELVRTNGEPQPECGTEDNAWARRSSTVLRVAHFSTWWWDSPSITSSNEEEEEREVSA